MAGKSDQALNSMKMLAIDMMRKSGNGHLSTAFSAGPIIYALYLNELNVLAKRPNWVNRDRFVLSESYASSALYSMLYFAGYDISMADLERYSAIDSFTPGSPEVNIELGVECSTGATGQGIACAVGMALAERYYENLCRAIDKKSNLIDYYTYVLCSESDLQEGISYEALSFASTQKLNKLVIILDSTKMQKDGSVEISSTEDIVKRFEALNFNIIGVKNGDNINDITSAFKEAHKANMPTLIICNTKVNFDNSLESVISLHDDEDQEENIKSLKEKYHLSLEPFTCDELSINYVTDYIINRVSKKYELWLREFNELRESNSELLNIINLIEKNDFSVDFDSTNYKINDTYCEDGRLSNEKVINFIAPKTRFFVGGSADATADTKTLINNSGLMSYENPTGRNIAFGCREHAMGEILNGMALSGLRVYGSTYLTLADYLKPAMRMSAMMNLPVTYIFTHDNIGASQDGPSCQPVEQLTMLRTIPNMTVFKPCDINETIGAWEYILKHQGPFALVVSNEKLNILKHTNGKYVQYGAYIVRKEKYHLDAVIVATGSEVNKAIKIAEELFTNGIDIRVVSMPSVELFCKQNPIYEEKLLPKDTKVITLEAGSTMIWNRFATAPKYTIGIDKFGLSGTKDDVLKYNNFDYNSLLLKIKEMIESE